MLGKSSAQRIESYNAVRQGCTLGKVSRTGMDYLETPEGVIKTLPDIGDDELIRPGKLAELVRALGVAGYEEFLTSQGYGADGANKPTN
jgi:hypothetical protein